MLSEQLHDLANYTTSKDAVGMCWLWDLVNTRLMESGVKKNVNALTKN
jgi:hypothetical protein